MFHEGQFEGRKVRLPVFLGRRPNEPTDKDLRDFYCRLLAAIDNAAFRQGDWRLCERTGWPDNSSFQNIVAWTWRFNDNRWLIVVNLSDSTCEARVNLGWDDTAGQWLLTDRLAGVSYERAGNDMSAEGLFVELGPWAYHFLRFHRTGT
jgi:hypothetical protein